MYSASRDKTDGVGMEFGLSFGTNLEDRIQHLRTARQGVLAVEGTRECAASPLYETDPVDVLPEYRGMKFVNAVIIIESEHSAKEWLEFINLIETAMGRVRSGDKNTPRSIDIDILYAGDQCIDSGGLTVPHPRWTSRRFVLQPLSDERGDMLFPQQAETVSQLLAALESDENIVKLEENW